MSDGVDLNALKQQIAAEEQARAMLSQVLQRTLQDPQRTVQILVSRTALVDHPDGTNKVLLVAQPNGERLDIVLSPESLRIFASVADAEPGDADPPAEQNGAPGE